MQETTNTDDTAPIDNLQDMGDFFFKSLNDFILFTSGYYSLAENPPRRGNLPFFDDPEFIVEVASLQTASISFLSSFFRGKLMIPALAIEYFLNNRIQSEMIFHLLKEKQIVPDEENFLRCLSGIDRENNSFLELNDKVVNGILTTSSSLVARDSFFKAMSHFLHETPVGQLSITQTLLDTFLSSVTSYIETRSIAIATKKIYKLDEGI
ncbi:MAG: hypothetical protein KBA66_02665 [Leptospiraceae bacterium]|nr:hypothetical protein [Leptospiraceae bacterium]